MDQARQGRAEHPQGYGPGPVGARERTPTPDPARRGPQKPAAPPGTRGSGTPSSPAGVTRMALTVAM